MKKLLVVVFLAFTVLNGFCSYSYQPDTLSAVNDTVTSFNAEAATRAYLDVLTPGQKERSDAYFEGGYWIQLWDLVIEFVILLVFLFLGLSKLISRIASRAGNVNIRNLIYIVLYFISAFLISLPYNIYTGFIREHHYGLSNMSFGQWFSEELISISLSVVFVGLMVMLLYVALRKTGRNWWLWGSLGTVLFLVAGILITPVFISPLFNHYKPLDNGPVKEEILSLARANGVPVDNVWQFDASKQSTRISANVSGIGGTIRVSLNDNLLNKCTPAEIKSVMAHELGHYVLNHVYKLIIYFSIVVFAGFAFLNFAALRLIKRFGGRWGTENLSDVTSLPLLVFLISLFMFVATPVTNTIVRTTESEADIFGLNAAGEPDGFASVAMKLSEYRKIDPAPLEEMIFFDHPSGKARVSMAMRWKAEHPDHGAGGTEGDGARY